MEAKNSRKDAQAIEVWRKRTEGSVTTAELLIYYGPALSTTSWDYVDIGLTEKQRTQIAGEENELYKKFNRAIFACQPNLSALRTLSISIVGPHRTVPKRFLEYVAWHHNIEELCLKNSRIRVTALAPRLSLKKFTVENEDTPRIDMWAGQPIDILSGGKLEILCLASGKYHNRILRGMAAERCSKLRTLSLTFALRVETINHLEALFKFLENCPELDELEITRCSVSSSVRVDELNISSTAVTGLTRFTGPSELAGIIIPGRPLVSVKLTNADFGTRVVRGKLRYKNILSRVAMSSREVASLSIPAVDLFTLPSTPGIMQALLEVTSSSNNFGKLSQLSVTDLRLPQKTPRNFIERGLSTRVSDVDPIFTVEGLHTERMVSFYTEFMVSTAQFISMNVTSLGVTPTGTKQRALTWTAVCKISFPASTEKAFMEIPDDGWVAPRARVYYTRTTRIRILKRLSKLNPRLWKISRTLPGSDTEMCFDKGPVVRGELVWNDLPRVQPLIRPPSEDGLEFGPQQQQNKHADTIFLTFSFFPPEIC